MREKYKKNKGGRQRERQRDGPTDILDGAGFPGSIEINRKRERTKDRNKGRNRDGLFRGIGDLAFCPDSFADVAGAYHRRMTPLKIRMRVSVPRRGASARAPKSFSKYRPFGNATSG